MIVPSLIPTLKLSALIRPIIYSFALLLLRHGSRAIPTIAQ